MSSVESSTIRDNVDAILVKAGITFSISYTGEGQDEPDTSTHQLGEPKPQPWKFDGWAPVFEQRNTDTGYLIGRMQTTFRTGLGHRKLPKGHHFGMHRGYVREGTLAWEQNQKFYKPVAPRAADVLYSALMDSQARDASFNDWCSDFGYDSDSMKAFSTYQACCKIAEDLARVFPRDVQQLLRDALEDF